jgi:hypothetical protein
MEYDKIIVICLVFFCGIVMSQVSKAETYPKCGLYDAYRCVPVYGNKVKCGCGL